MTRLPLSQLTLNKWTLYTSGGWLLGVLLVVLLGTFLGQSMVGAGMGAGVGLLQWMVLRQHAGTKASWFWFSLIGFFIPFLAFDLISTFISTIKPETYLPIATLIGALIAGWLQYRFILNRSYHNAANWILLNALGWVAAAVITFLGYSFNPYLSRPVSMTLAFILLVIGGPILALISGPTILSILNRIKIASIKTNEPAGSTTIIQSYGEPTTGDENSEGDSIG